MTAFKVSVMLFSFYLLSQLPSKTVIGNVIAVTSGDSFSITVDGTDFRVRVSEVDSPDIKQAFYRQASDFTKDLIFGKKVHVNYESVDWTNKEIVGEVILPDGRSLASELIGAGMAWYYRVKPTVNEVLAKLEYAAWSRKIGLWVDPSPVPPWEFRREAIVPDPPERPEQVDYDQILSYGLVGNKKTKTYQWPACGDYRVVEPDARVIFSNKLQAASLGYKMANSCVGH